MKKILLVLSILSSLSSFAATKIMMASDMYYTEAMLTAGETPMKGTFVNQTERYGKCEGTYEVMPKDGTMTIEIRFPTEMCNLQGMNIVMTTQSFDNFMKGMQVPVIFKQLQFYMNEMPAMLRVIPEQ